MSEAPTELPRAQNGLERAVLVLADEKRKALVSAGERAFLGLPEVVHEPWPNFKVFRVLYCPLFAVLLFTVHLVYKRKGRDCRFLDRLSIDQREGADKNRAISLIAYFVARSEELQV